MATSTTISLPAGTWTEVATSSYNAITNNGHNAIYLKWSVSAPASDAVGVLVYVGDGVDNSTFGDGAVYGRPLKDTGSVEVVSD